MTQTLPIVRQPDVWPPRINMFGVDIHAVTMKETVSVIRQWITDGVGCRYVVTPNVDHIVMLQEHDGLRAAYADAGLVLADGWPVVAASRILGKRLPERVAGSDLVPSLFASSTGPMPLRVYLLGAAPGVGYRAASNIQERWPAVKVVGVDSPPIGFERYADESEMILARIAIAKPDLLIVGLGAPKQELWVHHYQQSIQASVAICAGATIDFLAGEKRRAPKWMRRCGVEWLHRLCSEPRRLGKRYLKDGLTFPRIVWREWKQC